MLKYVSMYLLQDLNSLGVTPATLLKALLKVTMLSNPTEKAISIILDSSDSNRFFASSIRRRFM